MKNVNYRQTAGGFKYDDFDVKLVVNGKEYDAATVTMDFDEKTVKITAKTARKAEK